MRSYNLAIYFSYPLGKLTTNLISLLTGFFLATVLATLPSQTGDWGIVAGGIYCMNCYQSYCNNNCYVKKVNKLFVC
nr:Ycf20 [Erythrotrichia foliiformis]